MPMASDELVASGGAQFPQFVEAGVGAAQPGSPGAAAQAGCAARCASRRGRDHRRVARRRPGGRAPNSIRAARDVAVGRPGSGAHVPAVRGVQIACGLQMLGDQGGVLVDRSGSRCFDRGGHAPVQLGAIGLELSLVGDRTNQRVVEHILGLAGELDLIDELGCHQVVNDGFDAQLGQQVQAEPRPDDRRRAQRAFCFWVEADRCVRRWSPATWQAHSPRQTSAVETYAPRLPAQHATLGQFAHDLLGEERITGGPLGDRLAQPADRGVRPEQLRDQCCSLRITQRRKGYVCAPCTRVSAPRYSGR